MKILLISDTASPYSQDPADQAAHMILAAMVARGHECEARIVKLAFPKYEMDGVEYHKHEDYETGKSADGAHVVLSQPSAVQNAVAIAKQASKPLAHLVHPGYGSSFPPPEATAYAKESLAIFLGPEPAAAERWAERKVDCIGPDPFEKALYDLAGIEPRSTATAAVSGETPAKEETPEPQTGSEKREIQPGVFLTSTPLKDFKRNEKASSVNGGKREIQPGVFLESKSVGSETSKIDATNALEAWRRERGRTRKNEAPDKTVGQIGPGTSRSVPRVINVVDFTPGRYSPPSAARRTVDAPANPEDKPKEPPNPMLVIDDE
jgi:hypothetical protein